ncbi:MAG: outer membrane beta-barrel protein [Flavobacteriales bacterium]|nr:outer membrane beta-barrel protein [Flavobacteriales bacterium]
MYLVRAISLSAVLLVISIHGFGQRRLDLHLAGGVSHISDEYETQFYSQTHETPIGPSFKLGVISTGNLAKNSIIRSGIEFNQIEGVDIQEWDLGLYVAPTGHFKIDVRMHVSYLTVPIYYGFQMERFCLYFGVRGSVAVLREYNQQNIHTEGDSVGVFNSTRNKLDEVSIVDYGVSAGSTFQFNDKLGIELNYYYGLNDILDLVNESEGRWGVQQGTLGLNYRLRTVNKEILSEE